MMVISEELLAEVDVCLVRVRQAKVDVNDVEAISRHLEVAPTFIILDFSSDECHRATGPNAPLFEGVQLCNDQDKMS